VPWTNVIIICQRGADKITTSPKGKIEVETETITFPGETDSSRNFRLDLQMFKEAWKEHEMSSCRFYLMLAQREWHKYTDTKTDIKDM